MNDPNSMNEPPIRKPSFGTMFPVIMVSAEGMMRARNELRAEREADEAAGRKVKLKVPSVFRADD